jgi:Streptomycin adenylyltransferase
MQQQAGRGPRLELLARVCAAVTADPRVAGMLDYGSSSYGRADEWSDLDLALFLRDDGYDSFIANWRAWAGGFGRLLLAYVGHIGHPWTVYDATPVPLRVDFEFTRESEMETVLAWPNSPLSVEAMVLYDGTGGRLSRMAATLVGKSLAPQNPAAAFERLCGDFWYFLLMTCNKLRRGELWVARMVYFSESLDQLCYLLRLEAGAVERWQASQAAFEIERTLSAARLTQLARCLPGSGPDAGAEGLTGALLAAAQLGSEVCEAVSAQQGVGWPHELAERVLQTLGG